MEYHKLSLDFKDYLLTLGYSQQVCYELPNTINRFLNYFYEKEKRLSKISRTDMDCYITYIKESISEKTNRKRSIIQINSYIYALRHFEKFLNGIKGQKLPIYHLEYFKETDKKSRTPLRIEDINKLFEVTDNTKFGMRDRAMLTLFYSCGLRRNEGINVETTDIDFKQKLIFVRRGKFGKQRYVPFTEQSKEYLEEYINIGRKRFIRKGETKIRKTLFVSNRGLPLDSQSLLNRLKQLSEKANIKKEVGLHILRHSIATHLLEKGMDIYSISKFLGHSSLESTQIYAHIVDYELFHNN
jgi:integrase/recombinase XerD